MWDGERRVLWFAGQIVKRLRSPAPNQALILVGFQEQDWPPRVDDPLPLAPELDPAQRLHEAIRALKRHQRKALLHFGGDGSGRGVRWAPAPSLPRICLLPTGSGKMFTGAKACVIEKP